jgi:hypothetical protein
MEGECRALAVREGERHRCYSFLLTGAMWEATYGRKGDEMSAERCGLGRRFSLTIGQQPPL